MQNTIIVRTSATNKDRVAAVAVRTNTKAGAPSVEYGIVAIPFKFNHSEAA